MTSTACPHDEWLFPNINTGCVVKFDENGRIVETLWRYARHQPSDGHLDARAQGLSLCRRHPQQPHRTIAHSGCRSELGRGQNPTGGPSGDGVIRMASGPARAAAATIGHGAADGWRAQSQQQAGRSRDRRRGGHAGQSVPDAAARSCFPAVRRSLQASCREGLGRRVLRQRCDQPGDAWRAWRSCLADGQVAIRGGPHDGCGIVLGRRSPALRDCAGVR